MGTRITPRANTKPQAAEPVERRVRHPRESSSVAQELSHAVVSHKILRVAAMAILSVINCVVVSYVSGTSAGITSKGSGTLCLIFEAIYGILLVILLFLDDANGFGRRYEALVDYWKRIATRDSLTGLYNRLAFLQALDKRIEIAPETRARYGVMFIDLNKFKEINDTFGHAVGDGVLTIAARRIVGVVSKDDLVARLGGDEFAVLLMRTNVVLARRYEVELQNVFKMPMTINNKTLFVGASVGTCLASDHHRHAEDVIHAADILMYRQKALTRWGGNTRVNQARVNGIKRSR